MYSFASIYDPETINNIRNLIIIVPFLISCMCLVFACIACYATFRIDSNWVLENHDEDFIQDEIDKFDYPALYDECRFTDTELSGKFDDKEYSVVYKGIEFCYLGDKLHKVGAPAICYPGGLGAWYINGEYMFHTINGNIY